MQYAFGDTDVAAERLKLLAELFAEPTRAFLLGAVSNRPRLAVDLGCGPGYSTHFLSEVLDCKRVVGLDISERFIALAKETETDRVSFHLHDVTAVPFPVGPADLLYCRYLLTHVKDPEGVMVSWATQVASGGLLLLEETEWMHTNCDAFTTYISVVEAMLAAQSHALYVGPVLNGLKLAGDLKKRSSDVRTFRLPVSQAARLFHMNIRTWRHNPFVRENYAAALIDKLQNDLEALAERPDPQLEIEWGLRQVALA